jgi:hypothetical protein
MYNANPWDKLTELTELLKKHISKQVSKGTPLCCSDYIAHCIEFAKQVDLISFFGRDVVDKDVAQFSISINISTSFEFEWLFSLNDSLEIDDRLMVRFNMQFEHKNNAQRLYFHEEATQVKYDEVNNDFSHELNSILDKIESDSAYKLVKALEPTSVAVYEYCDF